jgi:hypothetical protein
MRFAPVAGKPDEPNQSRDNWSSNIPMLFLISAIREIAHQEGMLQPPSRLRSDMAGATEAEAVGTGGTGHQPLKRGNLPRRSDAQRFKAVPKWREARERNPKPIITTPAASKATEDGSGTA